MSPIQSEFSPEHPQRFYLKDQIGMLLVKRNFRETR